MSLRRNQDIRSLRLIPGRSRLGLCLLLCRCFCLNLRLTLCRCFCLGLCLTLCRCFCLGLRLTLCRCFCLGLCLRFCLSLCLRFCLSLCHCLLLFLILCGDLYLFIRHRKSRLRAGRICDRHSFCIAFPLLELHAVCRVICLQLHRISLRIICTVHRRLRLLPVAKLIMPSGCLRILICAL